jgi:hypothetical protein
VAEESEAVARAKLQFAGELTCQRFHSIYRCFANPWPMAWQMDLLNVYPGEKVILPPLEVGNAPSGIGKADQPQTGGFSRIFHVNCPMARGSIWTGRLAQ